jgi:hypothetical protein
VKKLILVGLLLSLSLIPTACRAGPIVSIALEVIAQISASAEAISQIPASAAISVVTINALLTSLPEATNQSFFGSVMSSVQVSVSGNSHARAQGIVTWHIKLRVDQPGLDSILIQYTMNNAASVNSERSTEAFGRSESSILARCCTGRPGGRPRVGWDGGEPSIVEGRLPCRSKPTATAGTAFRSSDTG